MTWNRTKTFVRVKEFVDHVRYPWRIAEGYNTLEAETGFPWCLLRKVGATEQEISFHSSLAAAKMAADKIEREEQRQQET